MKILFLHGWHSVPGGVKPTFLVEQGCEVSNPVLSDDDFDAAVRTAQAEFDRQRPDCIVGSSRGGAVALNILSTGVPLVLLCPAWKKWGQNKTIRSRAAILPSRADDVIPFEESEELIVRSRLPSDTLIEVGRDHRLADEDSLAALWWACKLVASPVELPSLDDEPNVGSGPSESHEGSMQGESSYVCDACGEAIVIPLDLTEGASQKYVEDCPVCCRANVIHVEIDADGEAQVWAEPEQDYD